VIEKVFGSRLKNHYFHYSFFYSTFKQISYHCREIKINRSVLNKKPKFLRQFPTDASVYREAIRLIELASESIPQLIFQIYLINQEVLIKNRIGEPDKMSKISSGFSKLFPNMYFQSNFYFEINQNQGLSIILSINSIVQGLTILWGFQAFYYFKFGLIGTFTRIFIFAWYLLVIPRIFLISMLASYDYRFCLLLIIVSILSSIFINYIEKGKQQKRDKKIEIEMKRNKSNKLVNAILYSLYLVFGVYKNVFTVFIIRKKHTIYYLVYYLVFFIINASFSFMYGSYIKNDAYFKFIVLSNLVAFFIQLIYQIVNKTCFIRKKIDRNYSMSNRYSRWVQMYNKYQIYISGELNVNGFNNSNLKSYLEDNYNINVCLSGEFSDNEEKFLAILGAELIISVYKNGDELNKIEIKTAKKLNLPILYLYNSNKDIERNLDANEYELDCSDIKDLNSYIKSILEKKFKIKMKLKSSQETPFVNCEADELLYSSHGYDDLNNLNLNLNDNQSELIFTGRSTKDLNYKIIKYNFGNYKFDELHLENNNNQLDVKCRISIGDEIAVWNTKTITIYNKSNPKLIESTIAIPDDSYDQILVSQRNKYLLSFNSDKITFIDATTHANHHVEIWKPFRMRLRTSKDSFLYVLSNDYEIFNNRDKIDRIFYKERPYISLYQEDEKSDLVFIKKIKFDTFFNPFDFQLDGENILIIGEYRDKLHHSRSLQFLLTFDNSGELLYKTGLTDLTSEISNFVIMNVSNHPEPDKSIIYCIFKKESISGKETNPEKQFQKITFSKNSNDKNFTNFNE
jgi:hypothetical protein